MTAFSLPPNAHPLIRQAHGYWLSVRPAADLLPGRQHIEPTAIPKLLPHVWMLDVQTEPLRFRYRLLGTAIRHKTASGENVIGRWMDEIDPDFAAGLRFDAFAMPVRQHSPSYHRGAPVFPAGLEHLTLERLFMPLAADGVHVNMLFCVSLFLAAGNVLMDAE